MSTRQLLPSRRSYSHPRSQWPLILFLIISTATGASSILTTRSLTIPLKITNLCGETIWPALASQAGTGPATGGFELKPGESQTLMTGSDWQGRVWGRSNCSFNADGSGASNLNGNNGGGQACTTGDCNGAMNCVVTGNTPVTLAEFDLAGGVNKDQTYYDISLVDGYNFPLGMRYLPGNDTKLQKIPPNLTNCACIATSGLLSDQASNVTNSTYPLPYNTKTTNTDLMRWCPWDLQQNPPTKPGDGVYPYPDDNIQRQVWQPCLSACARTNSPADCCTGSYNSPQACKASLYSSQAKAVCPDAYSYAFDDSTSTFIIPSGGGFEIIFCPLGRSTNILKTFGAQLSQLASTGTVSPNILADSQNITIIQEGKAVQGLRKEKMSSLGALVVMIAWACLL